MKKSLALAAALFAIAGTAQAERTGEEVYNATCHLCHAQGVAGAPMLGNQEAWAPRIEQGIDTLLSHAVNGFTGKTGAMPPKGTCMDCTDGELKAAIEFMISKVQ